jgi:hypothetical protein
MRRSAYVTGARLAELRQLLTNEEWQVLHDVAAMRLAVASDLQRLRALQAPLNVRSFRRQLARLDDLAVLARLPDRSVGGRGAGSAGFIYSLGPAGPRLLNPSSKSKRRPWVPRPTWLTHALAVSHLYVILKELETDSELKLHSFATEPMCWRRFPGTFGERQSLKPDAYVVTTSSGYEFVRFIEVDCGTESPATLDRKLTAYYRYYQSGIEQLHHDVFPEVLWLVPTQHRRDVVVDVAGRQPEEAWPLHRVALYEDAAEVFNERPP